MPEAASRVNVILDGERAAKLRRLADRSHANPGTIARSLLSAALDEADPDARHISELLDGIDGAWEGAMLGLAQAQQGEGTPLEDL